MSANPSQLELLSDPQPGPATPPREEWMTYTRTDSGEYVPDGSDAQAGQAPVRKRMLSQAETDGNLIPEPPPSIIQDMDAKAARGPRPHAPNAHLDVDEPAYAAVLADDQALEGVGTAPVLPAGVPVVTGVAGEPASNDASEAEPAIDQELVADTVAKFRAGSAAYVHNLGPFKGLVKKIESISTTADFVSAEVREVLMTGFRRAVSTAVAMTSDVELPVNDQIGLQARFTALSDINSEFGDTFMRSDTIHALREAGVNVDRELELIRRILEAEHQHYTRIAEALVPATLGSLAMSALSRLLHPRPSPEESAHLNGREAKYRNEEIRSAFEAAELAAGDLAENAGDPDWEVANGMVAADMLSGRIKRVKELVEGVEDEVDLSAVQAKLDGISKATSAAAEKAVDSTFADRLKEIQAQLKAMAAAIMAKLRELFGGPGNQDQAQASAKKGPAPQ